MHIDTFTDVLCVMGSSLLLLHVIIGNSYKATVHSFYILVLFVTVNNVFWQFYIASNSKSYLGFYVKYLIILSDFSHIFDFSADFSQQHPTSNFT